MAWRLTFNAGYEEETSTDGYEEPFPQARRTPSPPHASGGAYYPPPHPYAGAGPTAAAAGAGFTQHPNMASTNLAQQYTPYQPPDYTRFQPSSPPGPPPNSAATANDGFSPDPPPHPMGPEYVSRLSPAVSPAAFAFASHSEPAPEGDTVPQRCPAGGSEGASHADLALTLCWRCSSLRGRECFCR